MADFDKTIFAVEIPNHELLKLAYESYLAANRQVGAKTLRRGEVRGGGKKPWRQKGTGRARFGSSRNPIWRGGGIVFGPLGIENYNKKISATAKKVALRQALTLASQDKKITILDDAKFKTTGKTREIAKLLADNKLENKRRILAVVNKTDELVRASNNLANVALVSPTYLTVFEILNADVIIFTNDTLAKTTVWLKNDKKTTASSSRSSRGSSVDSVRSERFARIKSENDKVKEAK
jgi:large subunit ribosomal protein L4